MESINCQGRPEKCKSETEALAQTCMNQKWRQEGDHKPKCKNWRHIQVNNLKVYRVKGEAINIHGVDSNLLADYAPNLHK